MNNQPLTAAAHVRSYCPIHAYNSKEVRFKEPVRLFETESFGKPANTESGIVDEYVNVTGGLDDFSYGAFNRRVITNIEIDYADALPLPQFHQLIARRRISSSGIPHCCENRVAFGS